MSKQKPAPPPDSTGSAEKAVPNTPIPAAAALADVLAPQGVPHDKRFSIFAERPPQDARKLQKNSCSGSFDGHKSCMGLRFLAWWRGQFVLYAQQEARWRHIQHAAQLVERTQAGGRPTPAG